MRKAWLLLTVLGLIMLVLPLFLWPMLESWFDVATDTAIRSGPDPKSTIDSLLSSARKYTLGHIAIFTVCISGGSILAMCGVWGYQRSKKRAPRQNSQA